MITRLSLLKDEMPSVTVAISLADLETWGKGLIKQAKQQLEQQVTDASTETYPSEAKVCEILDVTRTTLWRWKKTGYLIPVEVGGKRRYRMSDINRILNGGRN